MYKLLWVKDTLETPLKTKWAMLREDLDFPAFTSVAFMHGVQAFISDAALEAFKEMQEPIKRFYDENYGHTFDERLGFSNGAMQRALAMLLLELTCSRKWIYAMVCGENGELFLHFLLYFILRPYTKRHLAEVEELAKVVKSLYKGPFENDDKLRRWTLMHECPNERHRSYSPGFEVYHNRQIPHFKPRDHVTWERWFEKEFGENRRRRARATTNADTTTGLKPEISAE